ncbi:MAG: hypothetical protein WDO70_06885 [Alphaproteobacteria bacterium]
MSFNLAKNFALSEAITRLRAVERQLGVPATLVTNFQGSAQAFQDSSAGAGIPAAGRGTGDLYHPRHAV